MLSNKKNTGLTTKPNKLLILNPNKTTSLKTKFRASTFGHPDQYPL